MDPARTLTVLHLLAPAPVGGLERVVRLLAVGQARAGHRVHVGAVVSPRSEVHPFAATARSEGVEVHVLEVSPREYLKEYRLVQKLCTRLRPDVVHTHGFRADVVDGLAARMHGIATVATVHGFTRAGRRGRLYEWIQRRSLRRCDAVLAVSAPQVEEIVAAGATRARVHLLPNAWATDAQLSRQAARERLGLSDDEFVIGWVGRLSHEKGPDVLVDASVSLKVAGMRVSVLGDGVLKSELERRAAELDLTTTIRWHGAVPDAGMLFAAFDALALSSRTEGTPMVLFEAMAAEVPIVATRVGGVPDVVSESEARLVEAENPKALADALLDVRSDSAAARQRAARAKARLAAYRVEPWIQRHTDVYHAVTKS